MAYQTNRTEQLVEAHTRSRFGQKASLHAAGVELPQHNVKAKKAAKKAAKKSTAKKAAKKAPAKKAAAKKTTAKKSAAKKTAKKS